MGKRSLSQVISCLRGGLTGSKSIDEVEPQMMLSATNINLHNGGRETRGGTANVVNLYESSYVVRRIYDFILRSGTQYLIAATSNGNVFKNDTDTIATGKSTANFYSFETFADELYILDGANTPMKWTGSGNAAAIANPAADWTTNPVFQAVKHGYGNQERMWMLNKLGVYASKDGDGDEFLSDVVNIPIETGVGSGLVGMVEYRDQLFVFGKYKTYIIDDTDSSTSNWGYQAASWEGGVAHWRLIVKTPTDLVCMTEDGEIYSVAAVTEYQDLRRASLIRPAYIHNYIKDNVNLAYIDKFHATFDPNLRAIKFFVCGSGAVLPNMCLVYFIDRPPEEAWVVHNSPSQSSAKKGYYTSGISALVRKSASVYKVYTGDQYGGITELETANYYDNSTYAYYSGFKTPPVFFETPRTTKMFQDGRIVCRAKGDYYLNVVTTIDGNPQGSNANIPLLGAGGLLGSFILNTSTLGGDEVVDKSYEIGETGKRIQTEVYVNGVGKSFFVSEIMFDYKPLGVKP